MRAEPSPRRVLRTLGWTSLIGTIALAAALAVPGLLGSGRPERGGRTVGEVIPGPVHDVPTNFRMATFNVLGHRHTAPGGNRPGWADGVTRMTWAVRLINRHELDVVGFQELQRPQFDRFRELEGKRWALYPGARLTHLSMQNSIAWRTGTWQLIEAHTMAVPYFDGNPVQMPYVLLQHRLTGRLAWFYNSHNPANTRGPAQRWRDEGFRREAALVNRLRAEAPGVPVFLTGDKNDRADYFCRIVRDTDMEAANGGGYVDGLCVAPADMRIDWIMGSREVAFTDYQDLRTPLVRKTTDHALVLSGVTIPPPSVVASAIDRVIVLAFEGLTSRALRRWGAEDGLLLDRLRTTGAATLNARTAYERTLNLPNVTGILTGRRVDPEQGGHGLTWRTDPGTTVHAAAGRYTAGVFDVAHDFGLRTALLTTDDRLSRLDLSWNSAYGGVDRHGDDNGRDKISRFLVDEDDASLIGRLQTLLAGDPPELIVANLSLLTEAGTRYGFRSPEYRAALGRADRLVRRVLRAIGSSPEAAGRTLTLITSGHGGKGTTYLPRSVLANHRVPIIATGPGVAAGTGLYTLNPQYTNPRDLWPDPSAPQPIRLEDMANLITRELGLPAVPGVTANPDQSFVVTAPLAPAS